MTDEDRSEKIRALAREDVARVGAVLCDQRAAERADELVRYNERHAALEAAEARGAARMKAAVLAELLALAGSLESGGIRRGETRVSLQRAANQIDALHRLISSDNFKF